MSDILFIIINLILIIGIFCIVVFGRIRDEKKHFSNYKKCTSNSEFSRIYAARIITNASDIIQTNRIQVIVENYKIVLMKKVFAGQWLELEFRKQDIIGIDFKEDSTGSGAEVEIFHRLNNVDSPYKVKILHGFYDEIKENIEKMQS